MATSVDDIVALYRSLKSARGHVIERMHKLQRQYNGDVVIPLPELDEAEVPSVANLVAQGVDQLAMRVGGRLPDCAFPVNESDDKAVEQSRTARKALLGWWDMNQMLKKHARRGRHLVGYGCSPVIIRPVGPAGRGKRRMPYWHVLNPLSVLPVPTGDEDCIEPPAGIIMRQQSRAWLSANYPGELARLYKGSDRRPDKMFDLLEYVDDEETVLVVMGAERGQEKYVDGADGVTPYEELERTPQRMGMCPLVVPGRITLDRLQGHFDGILGMFMSQAKMNAYDQIALFRTIFPELWVMSHPAAPTEARIIQIADGKQGIIGEIANGVIQAITPQPSQLTSQAIDRLERSQRVQAGIPADWGGESGSNIRTARRGEQVMGSAVDPIIAESQTVLAESMVAEDERAIALAKALWGRQSTSFYIPRNGRPLGDDFTPNKAFPSDFHFVKYSMPGVDAAGIPIEIGQRTGTGEMSMQTAREIDPMIEDPEGERDRVELEGIRGALLKGLEAQAGNASLDPHEVALIARLKRSGKVELEEAVIQAQEELQRQQAALAQSEPGSAETQPGMAQAPPPGAPQAGPAPTLAQLLGSLRQPTQQSGAEQQLAGAGAGPPGGPPGAPS